ncbi:MAG: hypothetical protein GY941_03985 [Planctomycetes bacterium]|nr:hypothetical protein [Planctomycetota bacterium]
MKIRNFLRIFGQVCIIVMIGMASISLTDGNDTTGNFSRPGYKPVSDSYLYGNTREELCENIMYRKWCERSFDNGNRIYEAYRNIAFNIEYTPEPPETDFWQTPLDTRRLMKGDCEDAVFHFFSQLLPKQSNAKIVWGWVINKQNGVGWAHVWYELTDKKGKKYIVEGFSKDWNGIIPMDIIQDTETRKPIFTISHCMVSRLSRLLPMVDGGQIHQSMENLLVSANFIMKVSENQLYPQDISIQLHLAPNEFIEYPTSVQYSPRMQIQFLNYLPEHKAVLNADKRISDIFEKLHEVFSRYENQHKDE